MNQSDWRLASLNGHLLNLSITWKPYRQRSETWDHDHCAFCWATFSDSRSASAAPGDLHEGYAVEAHVNQGRCVPADWEWICPRCYEDFKDMFNWHVSRQ
jgi:hypothetical protein